jgi:quercetin dioxygenase-like cupin family protein
MVLLLSLMMFLLAPGQQPERSSAPDALTLDGARPIMDNPRVTVWDLTWSRGVPEVMERTTTNAIWVSVAPNEGQVVYWPRGSARRAAASENAMARSIVVSLKDAPPATKENKSGYPNAFPRPGSRKILENERVIIWDYTWTTGQPTPMHFHDKDALVVYLKNGALKSTTPDGKSVVNPLTVGKTTFNARDRVHTETLVEGESRAIITELK